MNIQLNKSPCLDDESVKCEVCDKPLSLRERQKHHDLCVCDSCASDFYNENVVGPALEAEGHFVYYGNSDCTTSKHDHDEISVQRSWRDFHCPTCGEGKKVFSTDHDFSNRIECNDCEQEKPIPF